jgi:hypothetical protein
MDKEMINYTSILTDNTDEPEKPKKPIKPKFNQVFKVKEGNFKKNKCSCGCSLKHNNDKK